MRKASISLGIAMMLLGSAASALVEKHKVSSPHEAKDLRSHHINESDVFDDPGLGRSSETYEPHKK